MKDVAAQLQDIEETPDLLERSLKLSGLITALFREVGWNLVKVARKIMGVCLSGATPVDWAEVDRLAALPAFNIKKELGALKRKVERESGDKT